MSAVPPPMSTTMWPSGLVMSMPAPMAAATRLLDEVDPAGAGLDARVDDGALLDLGDAGGHADHDPGLEQADGGHLADELPEHPLRHVVVGDDAVPQRADGDDVAGGAAQHLLGLGADLQQLAGVLVDGTPPTAHCSTMPLPFT